MTDLHRLPYRKEGVRVRYEGSIDKAGGNADYEWFLFEDDRKEYVIFDVEGPGCLYNFVQHRYPTSEEPVFRFYFDHEKTPRFTIKHSEFGERYPFVEPLASRYIGPPENGRGPIRVLRSYVPMPFRFACRITSSVHLSGFEKSRGEGGWGHVIYHVYSDGTDIRTFSPEDDYDGLIRMWKNVGSDPKRIADHPCLDLNGVAVPAGKTVTILSEVGCGALTSIRCRISEREALEPDLWIRATWDNHSQPDFEIPMRCLFANELMQNRTCYLMAGFEPDGISYNHFPMPYWKSARVELVNKGNVQVSLPWIGIWKADDRNLYPESQCLYFRASPYYPRKATPGFDSILADIHGYGHMVSALITAHGSYEHDITCEGDVRVHFDDIKTPQIESDGSESYSCYGWGFATPPETNPASGYDGSMHSPWSMNRHCIGDWYPFDWRLRFGIESGGCNDQYLEHSGTVFYYGRDGSAAELTDELDIGNDESERQHDYEVKGAYRRVTLEASYEGDEDHVFLSDTGVLGIEESRFVIRIAPDNHGVRLRRRSDQQDGRQCASVFVDGQELCGRNWYFADKNPIKRWLDDEFEIPMSMTQGKSQLTIRIVPRLPEEGFTWNEFTYQVFTLINR